MAKKLQILGEFFSHLVLGAAMFGCLLLFGGAVSMLDRWSAPIIRDESFSFLMKIVEDCILYADMAFVVWVAVYSTYKAMKEIMKDE